MDTLLIQLTNNKAYKLLQDLEDLSLIKVLKKEHKETTVATKSNTSRFRGALKLTTQQYNDFQQHVKDMRNEWNNNI